MAMPPLRAINHRLTGNCRLRPGWFGRHIFQVEEEYETSHFPGQTYGKKYLRWRDATAFDIQRAASITLK